MKKFIVAMILGAVLVSSSAMAGSYSSLGMAYYAGILEDQADARAAEENAARADSPFGTFNFSMPTYDSSSLTNFWNLLMGM